MLGRRPIAAPRPAASPSLAIPLVVAGFAAVSAEAAQAGLAARHMGAGTSSIAFTAWEALGTVAIPVVILAVLGAPIVRSLVERQQDSGDARSRRVNRTLGLGVLSAAASGSAGFARRLAVHVSVNVAISVAILAALWGLAAFAALVLWLAPHVTTLLARIDRRFPRARFFTGDLVFNLIGATSVSLALSTLLPPSFLFTAAVGVYALAITFVPAVRTRLGRLFARRRGHAALAVLALIVVPAPFALGKTPASVRLVLLFRTPVAGPLLVGARSLVDRDGDGYSPILLGGDCNDHDAQIHPGAPDAPGNGVDENCSGADAKPFVAVEQPAFDMPPVPPKQNIVLVLLDALRPDHVSFTGYPRRTSPSIDAFRAQATWFERTYSPAPATRFALAGLFTGVDIERIPQTRGPGNDFHFLPGSVTLADRLGSSAYTRTGYTTSYVIQHVFGVGQGFDQWTTPWPVDDWKSSYKTSATKTTDAALAYLRDAPTDGSKPYFLFLHYICTHDPYAYQPRWNFGGAPVDHYDSALAYCDDEIGIVLRELQARPDYGRTTVVVFSDHGELFGEHGFLQHSNSLFEPDVRTMLLVKVGGLTQQPTVHTPVSLLDLAPTLESLGGVDAHVSRAGWNLLPFLVHGDAAANPRRPFRLYQNLTKGTVHHESRGVVIGRYKLIRDLSSGTTQLFDVIDDPAETTDLTTAAPQIKDDLEETLEQLYVAPDPSPATATRERPGG